MGLRKREKERERKKETKIVLLSKFAVVYKKVIFLTFFESLK